MSHRRILTSYCPGLVALLVVLFTAPFAQAGGGKTIPIAKPLRSAFASTQVWPLTRGQRIVYHYTRERVHPGSADSVSDRAEGYDTLVVESLVDSERGKIAAIHDPLHRRDAGFEFTAVYLFEDSSVSVEGTQNRRVEQFRFPIKQGATWGRDPDHPAGGDKYVWKSEGLSVAETALGRYEAWKLRYRSDLEQITRWFVPGVGIVREEVRPVTGGVAYVMELASR